MLFRSGLSLIAWRLLGVYIATIVGLVLKPYGEPVILLAAVAVSGAIIGNTEGAKEFLKAGDILNGYKSGTTWLIFTAFTLSCSPRSTATPSPTCSPSSAPNTS